MYKRRDTYAHVIQDDADKVHERTTKKLALDQRLVPQDTQE